MTSYENETQQISETFDNTIVTVAGTAIDIYRLCGSTVTPQDNTYTIEQPATIPYELLEQRGTGSDADRTERGDRSREAYRLASGEIR